ncbi:MAG: tRNA (adenosine(37)-N6)-dimethylallyltransferase MiaA [Xanthomonadaceae bacterium]|nr:tRNA (adenosine(37)-N6)-dimethylallyltransferase MiaA [Xanthomonadaceae bacterium]
MKIVIISGPTATGKTATALSVAKTFGAEIINADSMQVYRSLDIGTAKPTREEQQRVPHHLLDIVEPDDLYHAGSFQSDADAMISDLWSRQKLPLIVGGTGLYIRSLLYGLCDLPEIQLEIRQQVQNELEIQGVESLYQRLQEVDPLVAARLAPRDQSRIARALEVYLATGRSINSFQEQHRFSQPKYSFLYLYLACERIILRQRIADRVRQMMNYGFLDEVRGLLDKGYSPELKPLQSIGYRQLILHLQGVLPLDEALRLIVRDTRRYAKRQNTWFSRVPGIKIVNENERKKIPQLIHSFLDAEDYHC